MELDPLRSLLVRASRELPTVKDSAFYKKLKPAIEKAGLQTVSAELADLSALVRVLVLEFANEFCSLSEHDRNVLLNDLQVAAAQGRKSADTETQARAALGLLRLGQRGEAERLCEALADRTRPVPYAAMAKLIQNLATWKDPKAQAWIERLQALLDHR